MEKLPPLDYIESRGTRWPASALRPLLSLSANEIKAELKRLIGEPEPTAPTTTEAKEA